MNDIEYLGDRLTVRQLACALKRHPNYVYAMRRLGFRMIGGTATLTDALAWLEKHPQPTAKSLQCERK